MKQSIYLTIFYLLTGLQAFAKDTIVTKDSFETRLEQLLNVLETQGYEALEDFIHPQTGLFVTYRLGAYPAYMHHFSVRDFMNWYQSDYPNPATQAFCKSCAFASYTLKQNLPPYFDLICNGMEEEVPDKNILYVDDTANQTYLTDWFLYYCRQKRDNFVDWRPISDTVLNELESIESSSYRVAAVNHEFLIYMTLIDGEWYLTVLASTNCDA